MLTYQVSDKFANDYLNELADYFLFMQSFPIDDTHLQIRVEMEDAGCWHEKFDNKVISRTLTRIESAILNTRTKIKVPADLAQPLTLLVLYIAGSKFHLKNEQYAQAVSDIATSNYIKAHRLFKEKSLDKIQIEIRTAIPAATFNNLSIMYPLHEKVLTAIGEALMIGKDSKLYKTLHNPITTAKELKALEVSYSNTLSRLEKATLANGALLLGRYLKEFAGFESRGASISDDQIRVVYNIYERLEWVKAKSTYKENKPEAYIKAFRNFIRDNETLTKR
jgi:hypothetical protein